MKKDVLTLKDLGSKGIMEVLELAKKLKLKPEDYYGILKNKTLLMLFEKPSLRTRLSFEAGMTRLGGHAIFYSIKDSPLGKKETIEDTGRCASRYCDIIMARTFKHEDCVGLAANSDVPVINALTNFSHPCQILADLLTIYEKKGKLKGLTLTYMGDSHNNVTHSLMYGCSMVGMNVKIGCPAENQHSPDPKVVEESKDFGKKNGSTVEVFHDASEAAKDADVIYTDSWMSYHIPAEEEEKRVKVFKPYQVNSDLMKHAKKDAIFMNCLPAMRGYEQTAEVIDGPQSVVFDEAENRLHTQNALMLILLGKA